LGQEANPFLGWRALRVSLEQTEMFRQQLRAILRVAADYPVKLMFPMVATLDELRLAREQVKIARDELAARGVPSADSLETGIMIEIPSAALCADVLAREADFFSVGTNDLTQYVMAAERGNPHVSHLSDALHPAVLKLMHQVAQAAVKHGKWAGVCGELAGDPLATLPLVGMGYTELSMSAASIAVVKQVIRTANQREAATWIPSLLEQESAEAVRAILRAKMQVLQA
jgi:phosphoenolpyruvate-protein kinase (PTS system EI component)